MSWHDEDEYLDIFDSDCDVYDPDDDTDYESEEASEKHMAEFAKTFVKGDCPRCGGKDTVTDSGGVCYFCHQCRFVFGPEEYLSWASGISSYKNTGSVWGDDDDYDDIY